MRIFCSEDLPGFGHGPQQPASQSCWYVTSFLECRSNIINIFYRLVLGIRVFVNPYTAGGLWGVYAHGPTEVAVHALTDAIQAIKQMGSNVNATSVENAKTQVEY